MSILGKYPVAASICVYALIFIFPTSVFSALPPPALTKGGDLVPPKKEVVQLNSNKAIRNWDYQFHSLQEFTDAISQSALPILTTGQTRQVYCVILRHRNDLIIACWPQKGGHVLRLTALVTNAYGFQAGVVSGYYARDVPLIGTDLLSTRPKVLPRYGVQLIAAGFSIDPAFHGIIKAAITVYNKKFRHGAHLGATIAWQ
jgi:hypothetical protein